MVIPNRLWADSQADVRIIVRIARKSLKRPFSYRPKSFQKLWFAAEFFGSLKIPKPLYPRNPVCRLAAGSTRQPAFSKHSLIV